MIKEFLYDADKIISKLGDVGIIPMCCFTNKAIISGKSKDNSMVFSILSKEEYNKQIFAFRDWETIGNILSSFKNEENLSIEFKEIKDEEDGLEYPSRLVFKSSNITLDYFLQRYSIIKKSPMVLKDFNNKKAYISEPNGTTEIPLDLYFHHHHKNLIKYLLLLIDHIFISRRLVIVIIGVLVI